MGFCGVSQLTFSQERGHLSSLCYLIHAGLIGGFGLSEYSVSLIMPFPGWPAAGASSPPPQNSIRRLGSSLKLMLDAEERVRGAFIPT